MGDCLNGASAGPGAMSSTGACRFSLLLNDEVSFQRLLGAAPTGGRQRVGPSFSSVKCAIAAALQLHNDHGSTQSSGSSRRRGSLRTERSLGSQGRMTPRSSGRSGGVLVPRCSPVNNGTSSRALTTPPPDSLWEGRLTNVSPPSLSPALNHKQTTVSPSPPQNPHGSHVVFSGFVTVWYRLCVACVQQQQRRFVARKPDKFPSRPWLSSCFGRQGSRPLVLVGRGRTGRMPRRQLANQQTECARLQRIAPGLAPHSFVIALLPRQSPGRSTRFDHVQQRPFFARHSFMTGALHLPASLCGSLAVWQSADLAAPSPRQQQPVNECYHRALPPPVQCYVRC